MADLLKTDYKDDLLDTSANTERKLNLVDADGNVVAANVSIQDITEYAQVGDSFGAGDINKTNSRLNELGGDGNVESFHVGEDGNPYITYRVGADTVTKKLGSVSGDNIVHNLYTTYFTEPGNNQWYDYTHEYTIPQDCFLILVFDAVDMYGGTKNMYVYLNGATVTRQAYTKTFPAYGGAVKRVAYYIECKAGDVIKCRLDYRYGDGRQCTVIEDYMMII